MSSIVVWAILSGVLLILAVGIVVLGIYHIDLRGAHEALKEKRGKGMLEDLSLATSDQLLGELRNRPGCPYLMLLPMNDDLTQGLSIEIHNIPPIPCLQMLSTATRITFKELRERGVEIPDFEEETEDE